MNSQCIIQFINALDRGDNASALSQLESGEVAFDSHVFLDNGGVPRALPIIFRAVALVREPVVLALVQRGASIDSFREGRPGGRDGERITPGGAAISDCNIQALSLCHRLGANMSCVSTLRGHFPETTPLVVCSGLDWAVIRAAHAPLVFLLDEVYTTRPLHLTEAVVANLLGLACRGSSAKALFEEFESRGFSFRGLEKMITAPSEAELALKPDYRSGAPPPPDRIVC